MHRARYAERQVKSGPGTGEGGLHRCADQTAQDNSPPGTSHGRVYCCVRYTSVALAVNSPEVLRCLRTTVCFTPVQLTFDAGLYRRIRLRQRTHGS